MGVYRPLEGRDICGAKIAARMQGRIVRRPMLQQEAMIERTRRVCREDERLAAAMMYGSFAQGEGDGFSERLDRRCAETFSAPGPEDS